LEEMKKNQAFMNFVREKEQDPMCRRLTFFSFLIKPIQRICKYPLFLKDVVRNTPETNPEHSIFTDALQKVEQVVESVNEGKRAAESRQKIFDIQQSIDDLDGTVLIDPQRRLIQEGDVLLFQGDKKIIECRCFLFNDLIVFARKIKGKKLPYSFRGKLELSETTRLVVGSDRCELSDRGGASSTFFFKWDSMEETNQWVQELKTTLRPFHLKSFIGPPGSSFRRTNSMTSTSMSSLSRISKCCQFLGIPTFR